MNSSLLLVTQSGSVDELYSLLQKDPCVLENVDVLPFVQTPLHEASSTGKMNLAMELMILKPSFAKKLNEYGFSPLHLAVENHQVELARELVKIDPSLVRIPGRGGMTALHLVAKKGGVDLLTEFLQACPQGIRDANVNGETALHIAVLNKKYEELKVLTGWLQRRRKSDAASTEVYVLDRRDREGDTALHVAAYQNDDKAVKQLLKCMSLNRNIKNNIGLTALDVSRANGSDTNRSTAKIIQKSGGKTGKSLSKVKLLSVVLRTPVTFKEYCSTGLARYRSQTPDGRRNALLVITALIITATYQTATQPADKERKAYWDSISSDPNETAAPPPVKGPELIDPLDILKELVLLYGFNTTAFFLSIVLTYILLPVGRAYTRWYIFIMVPLVFSYGLSVSMKYSLTIFFYMYLMVALGFSIYVLIIYVRWKLTRQNKVPNPMSELKSESLKITV
ncbi:unnamed protein product [Thlaspi arvense]|uniref:Uncharacterized protein n=1 Tax=Thlaspi arvense TaxID=13288 RepID=A0AAU9ST54_THLAR|nr:unnamed protein product [Thlaspi arvense]